MRDDFAPVMASVHRMCAQYPSGITGILSLLLEEDADKARAKSTLYADLNPNQTSLGKLKARDMYKLMKIAQNFEPLRVLASMCGFSLVSLQSVEPDAPTLDAEMLSDYPSVVEFHKAIKAGEAEVAVLAKLDAAITDLRQTYIMASRANKNPAEAGLK